jgi:hypothetical protein
MKYYHPGQCRLAFAIASWNLRESRFIGAPAPLMEAVNTCKRKADSTIESEFATSDFAIALGVSSS